MRFYENKSCPVCKNQFTEDDDIVYCPDCGTPHHRECWNLVGHCVNQGLHKSNYSYYEDNIKKENIQTEDEDKPENEYENESETNWFPELDNSRYAEFSAEQLTIDGESIEDIAVTVKVHPKSYVNSFKRIENSGRKLSWRWSAFFFGHYYLLYRKMYKLGIAFLCLNLTVQALSNYFMMKFAPEFANAILSMSSLSGTSPTSEQAQQMLQSAINASDIRTAATIVYIMLGAMLILRIIIAVMSDYYYKDTVISIIRRVKEQLANGATFSQPPTMLGRPVPQMNQSDMRKLYLSRRGGTSLFAPMMALLITTFI